MHLYIHWWYSYTLELTNDCFGVQIGFDGKMDVQSYVAGP